MPEDKTPIEEASTSPEVKITSLSQEDLARRASIMFELEALQSLKEKTKAGYDQKIEEARQEILAKWNIKRGAIIEKMAGLKEELSGLEVTVSI